jgi:exopolysaccharide production protein ExoZ
MEPQNRKIYSIQALRAIAAGLVVLFHSQEVAGQYSNADSILNGFFHLRFFGASGVHIFFVISGFIMIVVSAHQFRLPGASAKFFKRRLIRIVPVYWFYTSLMLLLVCLPYTLKQSTFDIAYTIKSYLFVPAVCPSTDKIVPLLAQGWTLSYEMYFYVLFAFFLKFRRTWLLPSLILLFSASIGLRFLVSVGNAPVLNFFMNPILLEFVFGCFVGLVYVSGRRIGPVVSMGLLGLGCLALIAWIIFGGSGFSGVIAWGLPAACIVAGSVNLERTIGFRTPRILTALGDSSYSLYLSHTFLLMVVAKLLKMNLLSGIPIDIVIILAVVFCIVFGHLAYLYIEKPVTQLFTFRGRPADTHRRPIAAH